MARSGPAKSTRNIGPAAKVWRPAFVGSTSRPARRRPVRLPGRALCVGRNHAVQARRSRPRLAHRPRRDGPDRADPAHAVGPARHLRHGGLQLAPLGHRQGCRLSFSAPSNGADFSTANGGGSFGYFGDRLVYSFMDIVASAGYLYLFGDSSVDAINNVTLIGTPGQLAEPITTDFNYFNVDPQVGQRFPRPVGRLGRYFITFTGAGISILQGGESVPIGDKVTNIWNTLDTSQYLPTFAAANIFGFRVMLLNGRFTDPFGVTRSLLLMFHPTKGNEFWSVASQGLELTQHRNLRTGQHPHPLRDRRHAPLQAVRRSPARPSSSGCRPSSSGARRASCRRSRSRTSSGVYAEISDNDGRGVSITGTATSGDGGIPGGVEKCRFRADRRRRLQDHPLAPARVRDLDRD